MPATRSGGACRSSIAGPNATVRPRKRPKNRRRRARVPEFDLDRHTVVEASAGTGKTYTLESLVRDLLQGGKAGLDQILLVTFTEKATGELKGRLRASLEKACAEGVSGREIFQTALYQFDQ